MYSRSTIRETDLVVPTPARSKSTREAPCCSRGEEEKNLTQRVGVAVKQVAAYQKRPDPFGVLGPLLPRSHLAFAIGMRKSSGNGKSLDERYEGAC